MRFALVSMTIVGLAGCGPVLSVGGVPGSNHQRLTGVNAGPGSFAVDAISGDATTHDFSTDYRLAGVTWVRTHDYYGAMDMAVLWPDRSLDPSDPASFDFTGTEMWDFDGDGDEGSYDSNAAFGALLGGGFTPYLRIGDSINNALSHGSDFSDAAVREAHAVAAETVVRNFYSNPGVFGASFTDGYVEIWNEPDNGTFWAHAPRDFFFLYEAIAKRLRSAFPNLRIGGPAFAPTGYNDPLAGQPMVRAFLDHCVANNVPLDFLSWHLYADDPAVFVDAANWYRTELDSRSMTDVESHLTEWNVELRGALTGTWQGAVRAAVIWMELQRSGNVDAAMIYRGAEPGSGVSGGDALFYESGGSASANPIGETFELLGYFSVLPERASLSGNTKMSPDLEFLGAADSSIPRTAILVANPTASTKDWAPFFANDPGCATATGAVMSVRTASAVTTSSYIGPLSRQEIPGESVQLAVIDCSP